MMQKRMSEWFYLKDEFTSFIIDAQKHARHLCGVEDRRLRDDLVLSLKECAYAQRGHHAIIWGNAGRGKTHLAHHLALASVDNPAIEPVYVDCPPLPSAKAPLHMFFATLLKSIPWTTVKRFVRAYSEKSEKDPSLEQRVKQVLNGDSSIYTAIVDRLGSGMERSIRNTLGWLGGESSAEMKATYETAEQITDEGQLARNVGALGEILLIAEDKNLIFLVDEAERLQTITSGERYWIWLSAIRELFRRPPIGLILFIIGRNRDDIPQILWEEEISSVIGNPNIHESANFAQPSAASFLTEMLDTVVQRKPPHPAVEEILRVANESIDTYPFTRSAFDDFIAHHSIGTTTNIPRAIIGSLERCARRAMTLDKNLIDRDVLRQVIEGA